MARSTMKAMSSSHRTSAPKVLLSSRGHIEKHDAGLTSIAGAREIIKMIEERRSVVKLVLGHNDLGDDGCRELFRFLCSEKGRSHKITEISLNANDIGDRGLSAITDYIEDNMHLRELYLQNNSFEGNPVVVLKFIAALNKSHVFLLSLIGNGRLSDAFADLFLAHLSAPFLHELHLSSIGLTPCAAPALVAYLTSSRGRVLEVLKCSGNSLGLPAIRSIVPALARGNCTLIRLEMHGNDLQRTEADEEIGVVDDGTTLNKNKLRWEICDLELRRVLFRNELLKKKTARSALVLLLYARALLLQPLRHAQLPSPNHSQPTPTSNPTCSEHLTPLLSESPPTGTHDTPPSSIFPFRALPTELQLHILTFLAPVLSRAQLARIFNFASTPLTLPRLLPRLGCIPDPSSFPFGTPSGCGGGQCMGAGNSVVCHRSQERSRWLVEVGCAQFEPNENSEGMALLQNIDDLLTD